MWCNMWYFMYCVVTLVAKVLMCVVYQTRLECCCLRSAVIRGVVLYIECHYILSGVMHGVVLYVEWSCIGIGVKY